MKREERHKMDMCYDGALVMPSSFAMMGEEEMTYVEGGETTTKTLKWANNYFKNIMGISGVGTLASAVFAAGTFGASAVTGAYFTAIVTSAASCYNKCQKWLEKYSGSKSKVYVTTITAGPCITKLAVKKKKLVR